MSLSNNGKSADVTADWSDFLGPLPPVDLAPLAALNRGKSVLITGAGGSIGSALAAAVFAAGPRVLLLLDHAEHGLYELQTSLSARASKEIQCIEILGDICDRALIREVLKTHRPQILYHAAALKQVPIAESNPLAALRNNAWGTYVLAQEAAAHGVEQMIMVSTDKAVNPQSLMGASKRLAELAMMGLSSAGTRMKAVRFGNVLGSQGSVVPVFQRQIASGGPVTVSHPEVRRFFLTLARGIELVLLAASVEQSGIFIPELKRQYKILDLAYSLIRLMGLTPEKDITVTFTGLRHGDKMSEELLALGESLGTQVARGIYTVNGPAAEDIGTLMTSLEAVLERRDLAKAMELVCHAVPQYQPSEVLLGHSDAIRARASAQRSDS